MRRRGILILSAAALAALTLLGTMPWARAPVEEAPRRSAQETERPVRPADAGEGRTAAGCQVIQTMRFSRCGHSVTRRVGLPEALAGGDFQALRDYYSLWRVDSFSPDAVSMSRDLDLYCPMHFVLGVGETGEIALGRNVYGDGMAVQQIYGDKSLEDFSEEDRDALRAGLGFDSREEAEAWLRAH